MDIALPGDSTRFDYQSFDTTTGRLYMSHMGDGTVVVFDTHTNQVVANIAGFPRVTGVLVVPSLKRLYASAAGSHEIVVLDTQSLKIVNRIKDGKFPDGLAWSPETHKLFVSDESGEVETVIDTNTDERVDTIAMGGEVGNTQYDPTSHLIYACVQTRDELVAIDPATDKIIARYAMKGGKHPHGFYIDDAHRRAYVSRQGNGKLLVFNLETHVIEDSLSVGWVPDVLAFDRELNRLYVAAEMGPVSVFRYIESESRLVSEGQIDVGGNAHTVSVDSNTHKVYFPIKRGPVLRIMLPAGQTAESTGPAASATPNPRP
jgi:YVTN family beta-propeller protein